MRSPTPWRKIRNSIREGKGISMPIDARIPLGYQPPQLIDPDKVRQEHVQTQMQQQHARLYEMEAKQKEADIQEQQAFKDALGRGAAMPDLVKASPRYAAQHQKTLADQRKADYDAKKAELDLTAVQMNVFGRIAGTVRDTPSLMRAGDQLLKMGLIPKEIHDHIAQSGFTPEVANVLQQHMQQALTVEQQIEQARKVIEDQYKAAGEERAAAKEGREVRQFETQLPGMKADAEAKQMSTAGQAVGAVNNQAAYDQWRAGLSSEVQSRTPVMYSPAAVSIVSRMGMTAAQRASTDATATGQAEQARHNAASEGLTVRGQNMSDARARELQTLRTENRPPSSAERRVYGFYMRAKDAAETLDQMQEQMLDKNWVGQQWQRYGPNWLQTQDNQVYQQAQRQFTEARLRKDSGAAIAASEYENDRVTYFPQPGDGPKVLKRKAAARKTLLQSLHTESGRAGAVENGAPVADIFGQMGFEPEGK
jgi:hypothetical protein